MIEDIIPVSLDNFDKRIVDLVNKALSMHKDLHYVVWAGSIPDVNSNMQAYALFVLPNKQVLPIPLDMTGQMCRLNVDEGVAFVSKLVDKIAEFCYAQYPKGDRGATLQAHNTLIKACESAMLTPYGVAMAYGSPLVPSDN